jgi:hypothetical protein
VSRTLSDERGRSPAGARPAGERPAARRSHDRERNIETGRRPVQASNATVPAPGDDGLGLLTLVVIAVASLLALAAAVMAGPPLGSALQD